MSGDAFAFDDVTVMRGQRRALDGFTGSIAVAGVTALFGPSGSGKSTLLRLCNRLEIPVSGHVRYDGRDLQDVDPLQLRRQVGMVFQRPTPFAGTVRDNLLEASPDASAADLELALTRAALNGSWLERAATELSGGEAQRVCMARTLVTQPSVLLLDEPTSALDQAATAILEGAVCELARDGITVVWVSHDSRQAERIADHVVRITNGRYAGDDLVEGELDER